MQHTGIVYYLETQNPIFYPKTSKVYPNINFVFNISKEWLIKYPTGHWTCVRTIFIYENCLYKSYGEKEGEI